MNNKHIIKKLFCSPNLVVFLIGIILLIIGGAIGTTIVCGTVLLGIGTAFVSTSIVVGINNFYQIKEDSSKKIINQWGLCEIFRTRAEMNSISNPMLKKAKKLDVCAMGLKSFRDAQDRLIRERVSKGLKIRILTLSPESEFLNLIDRNEGLAEGATKTSIESLFRWVEDVKRNQKYDGQILIKSYDNYPYDFYFRVDNYLFCGPYLLKTSQQTITYEFKKGGEGYDDYKNNFETLWEKGK